jgi:hypothetical protein
VEEFGEGGETEELEEMEEESHGQPGGVPETMKYSLCKTS